MKSLNLTFIQIFSIFSILSFVPKLNAEQLHCSMNGYGETQCTGSYNGVEIKPCNYIINGWGETQCSPSCSTNVWGETVCN